MNRIPRVISYLIKLSAAYAVSFIAKMFCPAMRSIWIISERGSDARDNGYFFYKYVKEKHPEIKICYVISKKSADSFKIKPEDRIEPNSFRHYLRFALAKVRISSHAWGGDIPKADYYKKLGIYKYAKKKIVFLQHGITKDALPSLCCPSVMPDIFVCGAKPEYEYILKNFGHPKGVVQYTGLARFDSLHNASSKNQILIMPTFRKWLQKADKEQFEGEEYYAEWQAVLDSQKLIEELEKNDLKLIFYPHYELQGYIGCFHSRSDRIVIADFDHYDVQTLLIESKLLITDFSSVFFDFAYMNKPVLYYHFDRSRYIKEHYDFTKGYFDYDTMAPGKVVFDGAELVQEIANSISCGFVMEEEYKKRRDRFFEKTDKNNCDRIFEAIKALK